MKCSLTLLVLVSVVLSNTSFLSAQTATKKPVATKPLDTTAAKKPVATKPLDTKVESKPVTGAKPVENKPATKPVDTTVGSKPVEKKPEEKKTAETKPTDRIAAAKAKLLEDTYDLRYRFQTGESFRTKVVHLVTVDTKIQGTAETAKTRSVSTKLWRITKVESNGNITFEQSVEAVEMWQKMTGRPEVSYNSQTDDKVPPEYEYVANNVGKPMATITIDQHGKVVTRDKTYFNAGIGELTVSLPETAVKVGHVWYMPEEIIVRHQDKTVQTIKARQCFTLKSVEAGLATISVATEILTPINDPKTQSQVVQRMQKGTIKFDLDAGRIHSKQMDLDETVIGFSGAESVMQYLARLTEEVTTEKPQPRAAKLPKAGPEPPGPVTAPPTKQAKRPAPPTPAPVAKPTVKR